MGLETQFVIKNNVNVQYMYVNVSTFYCMTDSCGLGL